MNSQKNRQPPSSFMRSLSILHMAMFSGQLIMAAVMLFLKASYVLHFSNTDGLFLYLVPGAALVALFLGRKLSEQRMASIKESDELDQKLETYRSSVIINLALVEGAALLALMIYYITGNLLYILIGFALILYFFYLKPTKQSVRVDAKLRAKELEQIG